MWCKTKQREELPARFSREAGKEPSGNSRIRHHGAGHSGNRVRQMIAIARKRKQNSAYTTKGEARPGYPARASTIWPQSSGQCREILAAVRGNDGTPFAETSLEKEKKEAEDKDSERTFFFPLATGVFASDPSC
jgi:hypothetical protein